MRPSASIFCDIGLKQEVYNAVLENLTEYAADKMYRQKQTIYREKITAFCDELNVIGLGNSRKDERLKQAVTEFARYFYRRAAVDNVTQGVSK